MDREQVIAQADALVRRGFKHIESTNILRSTLGDPREDRPGGWTIIARIQIFTALGTSTRLVAINEETGERRIVDGWYPDQPYELRNECPDWIEKTPLPALMIGKEQSRG